MSFNNIVEKIHTVQNEINESLNIVSEKDIKIMKLSNRIVDKREYMAAVYNDMVKKMDDYDILVKQLIESHNTTLFGIRESGTTVKTAFSVIEDDLDSETYTDSESELESEAEEVTNKKRKLKIETTYDKVLNVYKMNDNKWMTCKEMAKYTKCKLFSVRPIMGKYFFNKSFERRYRDDLYRKKVFEYRIKM